MTKSQKIIIIAILIQVSALVYGIINRVEEVIVMTLIFIGVSVIEFSIRKERVNAFNICTYERLAREFRFSTFIWNFFEWHI